MKISLEVTKAELIAALGEDLDMKKPVEISLGKEVYSCYIYQYSSKTDGWYSQVIVQMSLEGRSKRLQEIADAKALVNKTKEAHKEAQRKLAKLQEAE